MSGIQPGQWLERQDFGDMTVLRVKAPMLRTDETTEAVFEQACSVVDAAGRSRLVLNFEGVGYMASTAIGKLILLMRKATSAGGKLVLCKLSRPLEEVLRVCRLSDVLPSYADEQEALQALIAQGELPADPPAPMFPRPAAGVKGRAGGRIHPPLLPHLNGIRSQRQIPILAPCLLDREEPRQNLERYIGRSSQTLLSAKPT